MKGDFSVFLKLFGIKSDQFIRFIKIGLLKGKFEYE